MFVALLTSGCSQNSSKAVQANEGAAVSGSLTVSAAASLQTAFSEIKVAFESAHPGVSVTLNFGASSTLAQQIINGAPVDVFASADQATMSKVSDAGFVSGDPVFFATNSLQIIVRKGNPRGITSLSDLAQRGLIYITCAPTVPIGTYAEQTLQKANVVVSAKSFEPDVRGIVTKVTSGEADAGIVYVTDIAAVHSDAEGISIPPEQNLIASYPIASLTTSTNNLASTSWITFVRSTQGQNILRSFGFRSP